MDTARQAARQQAREISASNAFTSDENKLVTKTKAGIHNVRLTSEMHHKGHLQTPELLVDINIDVCLASFNKEQQNQDLDQGLDTDIMAQMLDVKINLTQPQYFALMSLVTSVPKIFDFRKFNQESLLHTSSPGPIQATAASATADLIPGIAPVAKTADGEDVSLWTAMGLAKEARVGVKGGGKKQAIQSKISSKARVPSLEGGRQCTQA
ncbi:hypothetical protein O181_066580 [Austropuccinia psidii MF-1]|uniref:Uncharacterized protein n=1 Tax=Austropuccinia psidii MF-1 TaxID=1389203 RepID=A0A9Q3EXC2_9BASI|nr:hypothetical protein [Austropuccinia psidii MF-1]